MRVGLGYRSPTRRIVRSPLYFNSLVMAASVCRIMEQKIMLLRNGPAGFTYENVPLRTLTSYFCRAGYLRKRYIECYTQLYVKYSSRFELD